MTTQIKALLILGVLLAAFGAGWAGNGWRLDAKYQSEAKAQLKASIKALEVLTDERDALSAKLTAADDAATAKLREAQNETARLRNATPGTIVLRVAAKCPAAGNSAKTASYPGVDTGTGAELAGTARQAYFNLRDAIDYATGQLNACQAELKLRQ